MTDTGRQSSTDKAQAALKPDSYKSTTEQVKDKAKGIYDSAASTLQPEGEKSTFQRVTDISSANENENTESLTDKARNVVGTGREKQQ